MREVPRACVNPSRPRSVFVSLGNPELRRRVESARKKDVVAAIDQVKEALGNTRAVCRRCYVHPAVLEAYFAGETIRFSHDRKAAGLTPAERAVPDLLRRRSDKATRLAKTA